jgi:Ankyrin repeats (3 copies)
MLYENNNINSRARDPFNKVFASHPIYSESVPQGIPLPVQNQTAEAGAIPLYTNRYVRIVYQTGSSLDAPYLFGNTILHQALRAKDFALVEDLLKNQNVIASVNFACQGMTPLMIAVEMEEESMVELLLKYGADHSINKENPNSLKTALHLAATSKNSNIVRLLLKYGAADSISLKDKKEYTPFQRAIIVGNEDSVKAMLEYRPELAKQLNRPDFYGVTDIQRAARSGNIETVSLLLKYKIEEEIKVDKEASFTAGDLQACQMEATSLDHIPVDQIEFPLVIAQNFCSVMLRLTNGEIWKIPNANAQEVRQYIMEKRFGDQAVDHMEKNMLTLYLSPGHGFLRLECRNCDQGKSHNQNYGFYPTGSFLQERKANPKDKGAWHDVIFNLVDVYENLFKDQKGSVQREDWYENDSDSRNSLKITFYVDDKQAKAALNTIQEVSDSCKKEPEKSCVYNAVKRNCVSFVQEVYRSVGGRGDFAELFTGEQMNYGHFLTPSRLYEFKAVSYAYVKSRLFPEPQETIQNIYQNHLGNEKSAASAVLSTPQPQSQPLQSIGIGSAVLLGFVLPVAATRAFDYLSWLWSRQGEAVSKEDFNQWNAKKRMIGQALSDDLVELKGVFTEMRSFLDSETAFIKTREKVDGAALYVNEMEQAKWRKLEQKRIDLLCDWITLKSEIKELRKKGSLPSKSYLNRLDGMISQLSARSANLMHEVEAELADSANTQ